MVEILYLKKFQLVYLMTAIEIATEFSVLFGLLCGVINFLTFEWCIHKAIFSKRDAIQCVHCWLRCEIQPTAVSVYSQGISIGTFVVLFMHEVQVFTLRMHALSGVRTCLGLEGGGRKP